jgi:hypothetical protein
MLLQYQFEELYILLRLLCKFLVNCLAHGNGQAVGEFDSEGSGCDFGVFRLRVR